MLKVTDRIHAYLRAIQNQLPDLAGFQFRVMRPQQRCDTANLGACHGCARRVRVGIRTLCNGARNRLTRCADIYTEPLGVSTIRTFTSLVVPKGFSSPIRSAAVLVKGPDVDHMILLGCITVSIPEYVGDYLAYVSGCRHEQAVVLAVVILTGCEGGHHCPIRIGIGGKTPLSFFFCNVPYVFNAVNSIGHVSGSVGHKAATKYVSFVDETGHPMPIIPLSGDGTRAMGSVAV